MQSVGLWIGAILACVLGMGDAGPREETTADHLAPDGGVLSSDGGPSLEVGSGAYPFEPLTDGSPVAVIHGPQGGDHIWGSLRAHGLQTTGLQVVDTLEQPGDPPTAIYQSPTYLLDLGKTAKGDEFAGLIGYVDDPSKVLGHPLTMRMTATDNLGHVLSDEKDVIPYATW